MCALLSCVLSTMVFVLRRHIGEYDPDHPVADDEQDRSEGQDSVAPTLQPGLERHSGEKSNHLPKPGLAGILFFYVNTDVLTWAPVLHSSLLRWC